MHRHCNVAVYCGTHVYDYGIHIGRVVEISYYISMLFSTRRGRVQKGIFPRRVENVPDASPKYATIFQCYFGRVMQICDASKITFMTPPPE